MHHQDVTAAHRGRQLWPILRKRCRVYVIDQNRAKGMGVVVINVERCPRVVVKDERLKGRCIRVVFRRVLFGNDQRIRKRCLHLLKNPCVECPAIGLHRGVHIEQRHSPTVVRVFHLPNQLRRDLGVGYRHLRGRSVTIQRELLWPDANACSKACACDRLEVSVVQLHSNVRRARIGDDALHLRRHLRNLIGRADVAGRLRILLAFYIPSDRPLRPQLLHVGDEARRRLQHARLKLSDTCGIRHIEIAGRAVVEISPRVVREPYRLIDVARTGSGLIKRTDDPSVWPV